MNLLPKAITRVIESFEKLPGVGPKSAQRLAFYLLHVPQDELDRFGESVKALKNQTMMCSVCKNVTEQEPCVICSSPTRDKQIVCVVEQPTDVLAVERTGSFNGVYHVLHGALDPLNNIGPDELFIADLLKRIQDTNNPIIELIFALNPTMEGEATCMYIQSQISKYKNQNGQNNEAIHITRLAHGLPMGGDIEYADELTLKRAMDGRRNY